MGEKHICHDGIEGEEREQMMDCVYTVNFQCRDQKKCPDCANCERLR
jgi:hypothetical protein